MKKFYETVWEHIDKEFRKRFPTEKLREYATSDEVLERGSADFCKPYADLRTEDKALAYCHRYFRMHYESSYKVFEEHLVKSAYGSRGSDILFIDCGCGVGTSGFALADVVGGDNLHYVGVDRAPAMLRKASELMSLCEISHETCENFTQLPGKLREAESDISIFNFCFLLGHRTFRGDIFELSSIVKDFDGNLNTSEMFLVYQNPVSSYSITHKNWLTLKTEMEKTGFRSTFPKGFCNIEYRRDDLVYCDILHGVYGS